MTSLFLGITLVNLLLLCVTAGLGFAHNRPMHVLAGALATLVCCGVHCVVFTYFIATAKWIQHAVAVKKLDSKFIDPTRSFKMQAFPAALLAMGSVFVAAVLGAARDNYPISPIYHYVPALLAVLINALVAIVEYRAIARNGQLIDSILAAASATGARIDAQASAGEHAARVPKSPL